MSSFNQNNKKEDMIENLHNSVRVAIDRIGGPTKAANTLGVSGSSIHAWIKKEGIPNIDSAKKLAALSGMPVQELRGYKS